MVYDISDPYDIHQFGITLADDADAFSPDSILDMNVHQSTLIILHNNTKHNNYKIYEYLVGVDLSNPLNVALSLRVAGYVGIPVHHAPKIHLLDSDLAVLIEGVHTTLIQVQKPAFVTEHQRKHHSFAFNLTYSEHFMPNQAS